MSESGHHTREQVDAAFAYAPTVLRELMKAGVESPRLELFADGSGCLYFGGPVTGEQYQLAVQLVRSARPNMSGENGIVFCCGLVTGAEEERGEAAVTAPRGKLPRVHPGYDADETLPPLSTKDYRTLVIAIAAVIAAAVGVFIWKG